MSQLLLALLDLVRVAATVPVLQRLWRTERLGPWSRVMIVTAALATAVFIFVISEPTVLFSDFRKAYYAAGRAVLDSPAALGPLIEHVYFVNLPIVAYLFAPLAVLPPRPASILFALLGLAAMLGAWLLIARMARLEGTKRWLLLLLFAANGPLIYGLREGNTSHMLLLALAASLYFLRTNANAAGGAVLGGCALIKPPLALFGAYFLLRRNWGAAGAFAAVGAFACILSVAVFGWDLNRRWFELCVWQFGTNPIAAFNVQSIPAFLARLAGGPELLRDWNAYPPLPLQRAAGSFLILLLYLVAALACMRDQLTLKGVENRTSKDRSDLEYLLVLSLVVLGSPLSWTHYYAWFLLPIAFFLGRWSPFLVGATATRLAWVGIFLMTPAVMYLDLSEGPAMTLYSKLIVSHVLFGGFLWFVLLVRLRARLLAR